MKQSAAKTLGVAALGAAFAAAGAGAANAAPAVPDAAPVLGTVSKAVPAGNVTKTLPGADKTLDQAKPVVQNGLAAAQPATQLQHNQTSPVGTLLGGLPLRSVPLQTAGLNGLPLG
jgi:hypothetical protein